MEEEEEEEEKTMMKEENEKKIVEWEEEGRGYRTRSIVNKGEGESRVSQGVWEGVMGVMGSWRGEVGVNVPRSLKMTLNY